MLSHACSCCRLRVYKATNFQSTLCCALLRCCPFLQYPAAAFMSQPDYRLLMDRPYRDQARAHLAILSVWMLLEAAALFGMITRVLERTVMCQRCLAFSVTADPHNCCCRAHLHCRAAMPFALFAP
jgi:hypothetical protein